MSIAVLHHISSRPRRLHFLGEMARILKPGGVGLVTVWASEQEDPKKLAKWERISAGKPGVVSLLIFSVFPSPWIVLFWAGAQAQRACTEPGTDALGETEQAEAIIPGFFGCLGTLVEIRALKGFKNPSERDLLQVPHFLVGTLQPLQADWKGRPQCVCCFSASVQISLLEAARAAMTSDCGWQRSELLDP